MTIFAFNDVISDRECFNDSWEIEEELEEVVEVQLYEEEVITCNCGSLQELAEEVEDEIELPTTPDYEFPVFLEDEDTLSSSETEEIEEHHTIHGGPLTPPLDSYDDESQMAIPWPSYPNLRTSASENDSDSDDTEIIQPRKKIKRDVRYFRFPENE